jgi:hypothetical protein
VPARCALGSVAGSFGWWPGRGEPATEAKATGDASASKPTVVAFVACISTRYQQYLEATDSALAAGSEQCRYSAPFAADRAHTQCIEFMAVSESPRSMAVSCKAMHRPVCSESAVSASYARLERKGVHRTRGTILPSRMLVLAFGRRRHCSARHVGLRRCTACARRRAKCQVANALEIATPSLLCTTSACDKHVTGWAQVRRVDICWRDRTLQQSTRVQPCTGARTPWLPSARPSGGWQLGL